MTAGALLFAVRDRLRDVILRNDSLNIPEESIDIMPDDKPKALCGQTFISIYGYGWERGDDHEGSLDEKIGVCCCINERIARAPMDRHGHVYADATKSMSTLAYLIALSLHQWMGLYAATNEHIADFESILPNSSNLHGLFETLEWVRTDANPIKVGPEHFDPTPREFLDIEAAYGGFKMRVLFGGARRATPSSRVDALLS